MDSPKTPGQLLRKLLEEREWTQQVLATVLDLQQPAVNQLLADRRPITAELAVKLERVFAEASAEEFLKLQAAFDLSRARYTETVDPGLAERASLFAAVPVADLIKRHWLKARDMKNLTAVEAEVRAFLESRFPHAAKKTDQASPPNLAQIAWLHRARAIAEGQLVARRYTPATGREVVQKLYLLLASVEEVRHVPRLLNEAGIRFVIVETIPKAKIDGAAFWLDAQAPVIALSLRFDRLDNFWFVLRHELEHISRGDGREAPMLDSDLELGAEDGVLPEAEVRANAAASDFCVPSSELENFILRKQPVFSNRDILGFAARLKIHPSLVAGQLRFRLKKWDHFRTHDTKIRSKVTPGAAVDGWGDVASIDDGATQ